MLQILSRIILKPDSNVIVMCALGYQASINLQQEVALSRFAALCNHIHMFSNKKIYNLISYNSAINFTRFT